MSLDDEIRDLPLRQRMARLLELRAQIDRYVSDAIAEAVQAEGGRETYRAMTRASKALGIPYTTVVTAMDKRLKLEGPPDDR